MNLKRLIICFLVLAISLGISLGSPVSSDQDNAASDISRVGMGARPLGLGKAYTGLADDANAILLNPAGMAYFNSPKALSMKTQLLHDVFYSTYLLAWPTDLGTFGLGYVNVGINNIYLAEWQAGEPVITGKASYANSAAFLSYANKLGNDLAFGASLKQYTAEFANLGVADASAKGSNLDLGLMYKLGSNWSIGAIYQNVYTRPTLIWANGVAETMESHVRAGIAYKYRRKPTDFSINEINYTFDADMPVINPRQRTTYHLGAETWFADIFALRLGVGTKEHFSNGQMKSFVEPAVGLGLNMWGVQVDFAYAPGALDLADKGEKYFFSLAYQQPDSDIEPSPEEEGLTKEELQQKKTEEKLVLIKAVVPQEKYWGEAEISAKVVRTNVASLRTVMGSGYDPAKTFFVSKSGQRLKRMRLNIGENWLIYTKDGKKYLQKILVTKDYGDLYKSTPGYAEIQSLTMIGVLNGHQGNKGFYEPYAKADAGEMEFAVSRLKNGDLDTNKKPQPRNKVLTRREAIEIIVSNFGGSMSQYLSVLPKQVEEEIAEGQSGGYLRRNEMAQLLAKTNKAKERIRQLSSVYGVQLGEIYITGTYEDL